VSRPEVRSALLQYPLAGKRCWLEFIQPVGAIIANELRDVPAAMTRADLERSTGTWMVNSLRGWVQIEIVQDAVAVSTTPGTT